MAFVFLEFPRLSVLFLLPVLKRGVETSYSHIYRLLCHRSIDQLFKNAHYMERFLPSVVSRFFKGNLVASY